MHCVESGIQTLRDQIWFATKRASQRATQYILVFAALIASCDVAPAAAADWSPFVSNRSIKFLAPVACDSWLWWTPPQLYVATSDIEPAKELGRFRVFYWPTSEMKLAVFHIRQAWSTKRSFTLTSDNDSRDPCAVFVELPSKDGLRPYYVPTALEKQAELTTAIRDAWVAFAVLLAVLLPSILVGPLGIERPPLRAIALGTAVWIGILSVIIAVVAVAYPWHLYQEAVAYQSFYDALPREGGHLLPISYEQLVFLQAGPPHPDQLRMDSQPLYGMVVVASLWLILMTPAVWRGIYWLLVPLPLEALHEAAIKQGRAPTPHEIADAVLKASIGKTGWQLRMMQRKADIFARNLNAIARHL